VHLKTALSFSPQHLPSLHLLGAVLLADGTPHATAQVAKPQAGLGTPSGPVMADC
jgi:hypothetical protein